MRNFEIPHESDNAGEMKMEKRKTVDADSILEQRKKKAKEEVEGGTENADVYQPDNKKGGSEKSRKIFDADRMVEERRKREQEAKATRVAREQQIKAEDQKKIEQIRSNLGLPGTAAETSPLLEGNGWHEVQTPSSTSPERAKL